MGILSEMGRRHGTDKWDIHHSFKGQSYLDVYEEYFKPAKDLPINFLEIGVRRGGSLRMWKEYFPNATIYGLDNNPDCKIHEEERIDITIGSQADEGVLQQLVDKAGAFDVVLDDGSHINELTILTAKFLLKHMTPGGLYIIEDLGTSYQDLNTQLGNWEGELARNKKDGVNLDNRRQDMNMFFLDLIKDLDMARGDIRTIQFWSKICIMRRA